MKVLVLFAILGLSFVAYVYADEPAPASALCTRTDVLNPYDTVLDLSGRTYINGSNTAFYKSLSDQMKKSVQDVCKTSKTADDVLSKVFDTCGKYCAQEGSKSSQANLSIECSLVCHVAYDKAWGIAQGYQDASRACVVKTALSKNVAGQTPVSTDTLSKDVQEITNTYSNGGAGKPVADPLQ